MQAVTRAWREEVMRADFEPVFLVELTNGTWSYKCTKGSSALGYPEAVRSIEPMAFELDPVTRKPRVSALRLTFDDEWMRPILANVQLKHQKCIVTVGGPTVSEGNFIGWYAGPLEEDEPIDGHSVVWEVEDQLAIAQKEMSIGGYLKNHPLALIEGVLVANGYDASMYDANSLDPTQYADIGHIGMASGFYSFNAITGADLGKPRSVGEEIANLCALLNGQLLPDANGVLAFKKYDATTPIVDTWGADEIISLKQLGDKSVLLNRFEWAFGRDGSGTHRLAYRADDTASQSANAYPNMADRVLGKRFKTDWLDGVGRLAHDIDDVETSIEVRMQVDRVSGARGSYPTPGAQPTYADCHANRPVYLMIGGVDNTSYEIVKATAMSFSSAASGGITISTDEQPDPLTNQFTDYGSGWGYVTYTVERGALNTSAHYWTTGDSEYFVIHDITPLVLLGDELLARFAEECHMIEVETHWDRFPVELMDFVGVNWPKFLAYGLDGITAAIKWEVLGFEPLLEGGARIRWLLAQVKSQGITRSGAVVGTIFGDAMAIRDLDSGGNVEASCAHGFGFTDNGGRNGTMGKGTAAMGGKGGFRNEDVSHEYAASATTYVSWNMLSQQLEYTTAAVEPIWEKHDVPLRSVTCNADDITAHVDLRVTTALDGDRLHDLTVDTLQLNALAVTSTKIGSNAVVAGKIATGGVSAPTQIAAGTVGVEQSLGTDVRTTINRNSHFGQYSRG